MRRVGPIGPTALALGLIASMPAAVAGDQAAVNPRWREVWSGADVSSDVWLVYSGVTIAPWSHIHGDGVRLRVVGGYGQYHYEDKRLNANTIRWQGFNARTEFTDVLAGYLMRFGPLTAKAFTGASFINHDIDPFDDQTVAIGADFGIKGVIELWLNMGDHAWSSLDLSYSTAHDTGAVRFRSGYRILPNISAGVEAGLNVDAQGKCRMQGQGQDRVGCLHDYEKAEDPLTLLDYSRAGVFLRYEWEGGEISASGGVLHPAFKPTEQFEVDPYATVTWITQF